MVGVKSKEKDMNNNSSFYIGQKVWCLRHIRGSDPIKCYIIQAKITGYNDIEVDEASPYIIYIFATLDEVIAYAFAHNYTVIV